MTDSLYGEGESRRGRWWLEFWVVAGAGAGGEAGLVDADLDFVPFAGLAFQRRNEGEFVIILRVRDTALEGSGDVVGDGDGETAALDSENLKGDVAPIGLAGLAGTLLK